ncbi:hypothetical protein QC762_0017570 [Podospora pseudocomata]|uniref:Uncharacterized protein n=1 Tax=Podospora pseudocomata TaxID=2093779 RepID=A0ABR0GX18_9PEZI|nr:hypothetical protein QC762_0017570 [Podospora pseudocomata]
MTRRLLFRQRSPHPFFGRSEIQIIESESDQQSPSKTLSVALLENPKFPPFVTLIPASYL